VYWFLWQTQKSIFYRGFPEVPGNALPMPLPTYVCTHALASAACSVKLASYKVYSKLSLGEYYIIDLL